ncbi:bifunctional [glutamate--ammonia ligase]-adenylyl-L-tyrosine phosphorylase/[glutamate--ammonia-ligase] adenylyltransferase [Leeia oryzae]|uniref:bifunctional [glutamate--ammonia ligase]-adenylyl-L-tyrosine phosphorylase/[glutamate--ammonia-ligase] adenylyltransferase n=1 Tax=Leeia oryzae TaxID=356662 RepID=UPI00036FAADC|nr:bifunctional [glutamate--ammonia ligase]-adenylyl-L-tyrosine phosphorylase/[glutamate--ammonia-ligase] adenylyltransferase [Leeia oryzae]
MTLQFPLLEKAQNVSHYISRLSGSKPEMVEKVMNDIQTPMSKAVFQQWWRALPAVTSDEQLAAQLRQLRQRMMMHLIIRDVNNLAPLDEVVKSVSWFAEFVIETALDYHHQMLVSVHGEPVGEDTRTHQSLAIVGMGKLGGEELNVSSDIDLIFVYPEDGDTEGPRVIRNSEFFTRLGQRVIKALNDATADGFVFRVDMRLRPHGDSGPLVASHAMLENYLITQGREWERYAWMKARVLTGDETSLMQLVKPFVFRKYLDYGAYSSIRDLHSQIRREVTRRDKSDDIKLGPGGIREIEFIAQIFQLIRGGRTPKLQVRSTRQAFAEIATLGLMPEQAVDELLAAYEFLRRLEHRIQYLDDQQTQTLPRNPEDQHRLAMAMDTPSYNALLAELDTHRHLVSRHFEQVFIAPMDNASHPLDAVWLDCDNQETTVDALATIGYRDPKGTQQLLISMKNSHRYLNLPTNCKRRFDTLVPPLLAVAARQPQPDTTLHRLMNLLEAISRRESYLALLVEHPQTLQKLATLYSASPWVSEYLTRHPILLDELLDGRILYQNPDKERLRQELNELLDEAAGDTEQIMHILRHVHHTQVFRLVAQDLAGMHSVEALGDYLSDLADVILDTCVYRCWKEIKQRHIETPKFAVIGYGKLGGKELGYATDLDIIFLYDDNHPDAAENYARLAKRLSSWLTTPTAGGTVYELDLRLRPNGESGLLVSSVEAFAEYQSKSAWIWEHQALTRARFVAGDALVGQQFDDIKMNVLSQKRDLKALKDEVMAMRQKMHDAHPPHAGEFDVKHDAGGLIDVEFCVQYLVLALAPQYPDLTRNSGNIALLNAAGALGVMPPDIALAASNAYRSLRHQQHVLRLSGQQNNRIDEHERKKEQQAIRALWQQVFGQAR